MCFLEMYQVKVTDMNVNSFRRWFLDLTWLHMDFLMSIPCAWTHCSCVSVSMILFFTLMFWVSGDTPFIFLSTLTNAELLIRAWLVKTALSVLSVSFSSCPVLCVVRSVRSSCAGSRWGPGEERRLFLQALLHVRWSAQDPAQRRGGH